MKESVVREGRFMAFLMRYAAFAVFTLAVTATFSERWNRCFTWMLPGYFAVAGLIFLL